MYSATFSLGAPNPGGSLWRTVLSPLLPLGIRAGLILLVLRILSTPAWPRSGPALLDSDSAIVEPLLIHPFFSEPLFAGEGSRTVLDRARTGPITRVRSVLGRGR